LKLQAYLDSELPASEEREMLALLAEDAEASALLAELKNTRAALTGFEAEIKLPEAREFYWSKIERVILRAEKPAIAETPVSVFAALRRFLIPAGALAALVVAATIVWHGQEGVFRGPETETTFADSGAFTYRDYASGMTLVWVSYPAENDFAEINPASKLD